MNTKTAPNPASKEQIEAWETKRKAFIESVRQESGQEKGCCCCGSTAFDGFECEDCGVDILRILNINI